MNVRQLQVFSWCCVLIGGVGLLVVLLVQEATPLTEQGSIQDSLMVEFSARVLSSHQTENGVVLTLQRNHEITGFFPGVHTFIPGQTIQVQGMQSGEWFTIHRIGVVDN